LSGSKRLKRRRLELIQTKQETRHMNIAIFYDTETTGLPDFKAPSDAKQQPHIVQLAAAMVDLDERKVIQSIDMIIRPDDWVIPKEVSDIHGITHELAMETGVSEEEAINTFLALIEKPESKPLQPVFHKRIAHNCSFDDRIMRTAFKRYLDDDNFCDRFKVAPSFCTMKAALNIVKAPPTEKMIRAGFNKFKNPSLSECVKHFFDKPLDGAHNAMVDVQACIDVYFAITENLKAA